MRDSVTNPLLRFVVDPNTVSRLHPTWSPVLLDASRSLPEVDDWVFAVQPIPGEAEFVGLARVASLDVPHGLLYLEVDWNSFGETKASASANSTPIVQIHVWVGVDVIQFPSTSGSRQVLTRTA